MAAAGAATPFARPSTPQLSARLQAPAVVSVGDTFVATLDISSSVPVRGTPLQLRYSSSQLQLLEIQEAEFFGADGTGTLFRPSIEATSGTASVEVLRKLASGVQGQGTVLRLRMRALAAGAASIALQGMQPVSMGEPLPALVLPVPARVEVR